MRYVALAGTQVLDRVVAAIGRVGTVCVVDDVRALVAEMRSADGICVVIDPALMTPADVDTFVQHARYSPQCIVVYAPTGRDAFQTSILLAKATSAEFVFQGAPDEFAALRRALLLAPDVGLGRALTHALASRIDTLPHQLAIAIRNMLETGTGPRTATGLAAHGGIARRSMDRALESAGLESSRFVIGAARVVRAYRAVAWSRLSFQQIAAMAGYGSHRTLDHHFAALIGRTSARIRQSPLPADELVQRLVVRLTTRVDPPRARRAMRSTAAHAGDPSFPFDTHLGH